MIEIGVIGIDWDIFRRRMEDKVAAAQAAEEALEAREASEHNSLLSPCLSSIKSPPLSGSPRSAKMKRNGTAVQKMNLEDMLAECAKVEDEDQFTGHSCLLITWKTNPEVEKFKVGQARMLE